MCEVLLIELRRGVVAPEEHTASTQSDWNSRHIKALRQPHTASCSNWTRVAKRVTHMEVLLSPSEYTRLYNCSSYNVSDLPLSVRQNMPLGLFFVMACSLTELLYIPCLVVIYRRMADSCYKLMFFIGLADVFNIALICLYDGVGALSGWVYCSASTPSTLYSWHARCHFLGCSQPWHSGVGV